MNVKSRSHHHGMGLLVAALAAGGGCPSNSNPTPEMTATTSMDSDTTSTGRPPDSADSTTAAPMDINPFMDLPWRLELPPVGGGEIPVGNYSGTGSEVEEMAIVSVDGVWFLMQADSIGGLLARATADVEIEVIVVWGLSGSLAVGDAMAAGGMAALGGIPSVLVGFPGLRISMYDGSGWSDANSVEGFLAAAKLAMVPAPGGADPNQVCGASNEGLVSCVVATGTGWAEDPATTTDAMWAANCPTFSAEGLAVADGWAMLLSGTGSICHGQLGPGTQATEIPLFSLEVEDLECPADGNGASTLCAVLERPGTVSILQWLDPAAAPTVVQTIETCDVSTELQGLVADDDATVSFATACASAEQAHLITVDASDGSLVSHQVHDVPGCSGRVAALPSLERVAVACSGSVEVLDTAAFVDL